MTLAVESDCVAVGCDVDHIDAAGVPLIGYPRPGDPEEWILLGLQHVSLT